MKRSVFHRGFFFETVRQLRTKGLVFIFLLLVLNLITFVSFASTNPVDVEPDHVSASVMALPMLLFLYIAVPVITFGAYGWLNKRVQSDFYHAIPLTRTQMYVSANAAILLWLGAALISYAAVRALLFAVFGYPYNYLLFLCVCINMLLAAISILGALSIACALCGNKFTAFFSAIAILFLPRALLTSFWMVYEVDAIRFIPFSRLPFFLNPAFNIAATPIHSIVYAADFANVLAMLYSLLYGCALNVLGCIAFNKRRSEAAVIPYTGKVLQAATRIMFGLPPLAVITAVLNIRLKMGRTTFETVVPTYMLAPLAVTSVVFSFLFYCLYELISSRKMKPVVKSMLWYPVTIGIALILLFVPVWITDGEQRARIPENRIASYTTMDQESSLLLPFAAARLSEGMDYTEYLMKNRMFTDADGKHILAEEGFDDSYSWIGDYQVAARMQEGGSQFCPVLHVTYNSLIRAALRQADFAEAFYAYPEGSITYKCDGLTFAESKEVGRLFQMDYEQLSDSERELLMRRGRHVFSDDNGFNVSLFITLYGCCGVENYTETFLLTELTPNAAHKYLEYLNARSGENVRTQLKAFAAFMEDPTSQIRIESVQIGRLSLGYYDVLDDENHVRLDRPKDMYPLQYALLKALSEAPLSDDPAHCVTVSVRFVYGRSYGTEGYCCAGFEIDEGLEKLLLAWRDSRNVK